VYYEYYSLEMTEDAPKDYTEISFVCLREDGCPELPATVETACRTAAGKVSELEGFHFHILRNSHASLLISKLRAQPNLVADRLGMKKYRLRCLHIPIYTRTSQGILQSS